MPTPVLIPTRIEQERHQTLTFHVLGELVPVLQLTLGQERIYFEHHVLLWKSPAVDIGLRPLKGAFKRMLAGLPIFLTEAHGQGDIAFSRDGAGQILPVNLAAGQSIEVREHQFLAATTNVEYAPTRVRGVANLLLGGSGFWMDRFTAANGPGMVWLYGYGNVVLLSLGPGEQIDVEPGGWVFKDPGVQMELKSQRFTTGFFASAGNLFWNRFTGPGRVAVQSLSLAMVSEE